MENALSSSSLSLSSAYGFSGWCFGISINKIWGGFKAGTVVCGKNFIRAGIMIYVLGVGLTTVRVGAMICKLNNSSDKEKKKPQMTLLGFGI